MAEDIADYKRERSESPETASTKGVDIDRAQLALEKDRLRAVLAARSGRGHRELMRVLAGLSPSNEHAPDRLVDDARPDERLPWHVPTWRDFTPEHLLAGLRLPR